MARTTQDQTQERHAFVVELFQKQPELSRADAQEAFRDRFGAAINPRTLNQLREQALETLQQEEQAEEPAAEETVDAAAALKAAADTQAAPKAKAPKAKGPRSVFVDAPREQLVFLEQVVAQLQAAGLANLRVDHATDRWMVLAVEPK